MIPFTQSKCWNVVPAALDLERFGATNPLLRYRIENRDVQHKQHQQAASKPSSMAEAGET